MKKYKLLVICLLLVSIEMACYANITELRITNPQNGSRIMMEISIDTTPINNTSGKELWFAVSPIDVPRIYIQDKRYFKNGIDAYVGLEEDRGLGFRIYAILADKSADATIQDDLDRSKALLSWIGYKTLPKGAEINDWVIVTRG